MRDVAWREKLWSIYTTNPNNYKIRRFESKRMQQIDRKLRQYYAIEKIDPASVNTKEHYRTFDPSQLDTRHNSIRGDNRHSGGTFLLKDINRFESHQSSSAPPTPFGTNYDNSNVQITFTKPPDMNRAKLSIIGDSTMNSQASGSRRLSNRFTVEKIKDNVV